MDINRLQRNRAALLARAITIAVGMASSAAAAGQQIDEASVIRGVDASVHNRLSSIASYTSIEHYAVFRGKDTSHPAAEMTVKTAYRQESGKTYTVLSEGGSELIRTFGLKPLLENERTINLPGNRERSWFTSDNYRMQLKPGGIERINGHDCLALAISPRHKAPNLIEGTLWVDATDFAIVRIDGTSTKSPTIVSSPPHVTRDYTNVSGFAEATHATAVSSSFLFGRTTVTIDYHDYQIQVRAAR